MSAFVVYEDDIVVALSDVCLTDVCVELPDEFEDYDIDQLRVKDNKVIDVSNYTTFYIDAAGGKHIDQMDSTWQELSCSWSDEIEQVDGKWQKVDLIKYKQQKLTALDNYRKSLEDYITIDGHPVSVSVKTRTNMQNTIDLLKNNEISSPVHWEVRDGTFVDLDEATLQKWFLAVRKYVSSLFEVQHMHADKINALTTEADVKQYDFKTGWPSKEVTV